MRIYYLDTENIGFNPENLALSILDRVFVFTNCESVKSSCISSSFICISGYPKGQNQADFYIIAHLSGILATLNQSERNAIEFILLSRDQSLWNAFLYQTSLAGVKSYAPHINAAVYEPPLELNTSTRLDEKIILLARTPITTVELIKKLNIKQSEFTSTFNALVKAKKIKRLENSKRKWLTV